MSFDKLNSQILDQILAVLPADIPIYLVGGAVRDLLLNRLTHDLDFLVPENAIQISRTVANSLSGGVYALDPQRDTGRVIITTQANERYFLDFASFRGVDLESDLRNRDFTINAIALDIREPESLIDPLGGARDLQNKQLRLCSPASIENDPLRILRGARLASEFDLRILPETRHKLRQNDLASQSGVLTDQSLCALPPQPADLPRRARHGIYVEHSAVQHSMHLMIRAPKR